MQSLIKSFNMDRANFEAAKSVSPIPSHIMGSS